MSEKAILQYLRGGGWVDDDAVAKARAAQEQQPDLSLLKALVKTGALTREQAKEAMTKASGKAGKGDAKAARNGDENPKAKAGAKRAGKEGGKAGAKGAGKRAEKARPAASSGIANVPPMVWMVGVPAGVVLLVAIVAVALSGSSDSDPSDPTIIVSDTADGDTAANTSPTPFRPGDSSPPAPRGTGTTTGTTGTGTGTGTTAGSGSAVDARHLAELVAKLRAHDERKPAVEELKKLGPAAAPAIPALMEWLLQRRTDSHTAGAAREVLSTIGPAAIPSLTAALRDSTDSRDQALIASTLGEIGLDAQSALPVLLPLLKARDNELRKAVVETVGVFCPTVASVKPALMEALRDDDWHVIRAASQALAKFGSSIVPDFIPLLGATDTNLQIHIANALGIIGPDARDAVPALIPLLDSNNGTLTDAASAALGQIGKDAVPALTTALTEALSENRRRVVIHSTRALGNIGTDGASAIPVLTEVLESADAGEAVVALTKLGPAAIPALVKALTLNIRGRSAHETAMKGLVAHGAESVADVVPLLNHPSQDVVDRAADVLRGIGPEARAAILPLIESFRHSRANSAKRKALVAIGPTAVPELIGALKDASKDVRQQMCEALTEFGPVAAAAVPGLSAVLDSDDETFVRMHAVRAIAAIGPIGRNTPISVIVLAKAMSDSSALVRKEAAVALGKFGAEAGPASSEIVPALKDRDRDVRNAASEALKTIGASAATALGETLTGTDSALYNPAVALLGAMGADAHGAVPMLIEALQHSDTALRPKAAEVLGKIGPEARAAASALTEALGSPSGDLRYRAAVALGAIGPDARDAVPTLITLLKDSNGTVRASAADTLGKIGRDARSAVPALIEVLHDDKNPVVVRENALKSVAAITPETAVPVLIEMLSNDHLRITAAVALGEIGPAAKTAIPALEPLAVHSDSRVHRPVISSLGRIGPDALPILTRLTTHATESINRAAVGSLYLVGAPAIPAIRSVIDSSTTSDINRGTALTSLAQLGASATPLLIAYLNHSNTGYRDLAVRTLEVMKDGAALAAVPTLLDIFESLDVRIERDRRQRIVNAIRNVGPPAVPVLIQRLSHSDRDQRLTAMAILRLFGPDAKAAVPVLTEMLSEPYPISISAAETLASIGEAAKSALPALEAFASRVTDSNYQRGVMDRVLKTLRGE